MVPIKPIYLERVIYGYLEHHYKFRRWNDHKSEPLGNLRMKAMCSFPTPKMY